MKKRIFWAALIIAAALASSGCGIGKSEPAEQVIVQDTPVPTLEPTKAPTPTPTPVPDLTKTVAFTSADQSVSLDLPNVTWETKTDSNGTLNFESAEEGKLLILHGEGEDLDSVLIPANQDLAEAVEGGLAAGTDFTVLGYDNEEHEGGSAIVYTIRYLDTQKSEGALYKLYRLYVNDSEYYSMEALVKNEDALSRVQESVNSLQILTGSALKGVAAAANEKFRAISMENADGQTGASSGEGSGGLPEANSGEFTEDQINDTSQTRTIYRNSDGKALVIFPGDDGNWTDSAGNTYHFDTDEDVYDQNDVDYYYHGESANVYFMSPEDEE